VQFPFIPTNFQSFGKDIFTEYFPGPTVISLPKPDTFSPFGVIVTSSSNSNNNTTSNKNNTVENIFLSDHGSSRVILSSRNIESDPFQSYTSYWTSPSLLILITICTSVHGQSFVRAVCSISIATCNRPPMEFQSHINY
jgi:hypothetical protein